MKTIDNYFSFSKGDCIVVGCSAGPDSMALVDMLLKIRDKYDLFEWRGKKKESKLKESVRRQAPVQHLKSQKKKKENE